MRSSILLFAVVAFVAFAGGAAAQEADTLPMPARQIASPLPKLALMGAVAAQKGRVSYHKVILAVTNREKLAPEIFVLRPGTKLPPNPCAQTKSRAVLNIFDEQGGVIAKCLATGSAESLGQVSFLIRKGETVPPFVYITINDLATGAVYRSNLVSPFGGGTK